MAWEDKGKTISLRAPSTALSTYQYRVVVASSSEGYFAAGSSGANLPIVGVLQSSPTVAGEACEIVISGVSKLRTATTALRPGNWFMSGVNGLASSSGSAIAKTLLMGPVLGAAVSSSSGITTAIVDRVGITT